MRGRCLPLCLCLLHSGPCCAGFCSRPACPSPARSRRHPSCALRVHGPPRPLCFSLRSVMGRTSKGGEGPGRATPASTVREGQAITVGRGVQTAWAPDPNCLPTACARRTASALLGSVPLAAGQYCVMAWGRPVLCIHRSCSCSRGRRRATGPRAHAFVGPLRPRVPLPCLSGTDDGSPRACTSVCARPARCGGAPPFWASRREARRGDVTEAPCGWSAPRRRATALPLLSGSPSPAGHGMPHCHLRAPVWASAR